MAKFRWRRSVLLGSFMSSAIAGLFRPGGINDYPRKRQGFAGGVWGELAMLFRLAVPSVSSLGVRQECMFSPTKLRANR